MDNEAIEAAAAAWVIRRSADTWTVSEQERLDVWLTESTSHRVAYLRLDAVWQHTARLKALTAGLSPGIVPPAGVWRTRQMAESSKIEGDIEEPAHPARLGLRWPPA